MSKTDIDIQNKTENDELISNDDLCINFKNEVNDGGVEESKEENKDSKNSNYTYVDHLDEDEILEHQRYALFSFLSPEGIMNCNIRALKFRGAFPTIEEAKKYAEKLKNEDKYFKIFVGEQGKWMEFDPSEDKVEEDIAEDAKTQQIIDTQRKQKQHKMNDMAGRYKKHFDKTQSHDGKKELVNENIKAGTAEMEANRRRNNKNVDNGREKNKNVISERIRKKLELKKEMSKKKEVVEVEEDSGDTIDDKISVVNKASKKLNEEKEKLTDIEKNMERIRGLMSKRKGE